MEPASDGNGALFQSKADLKQRFRQWASSFAGLDPRIRIHRFFQEIAQRGELKLLEARQKKEQTDGDPSQIKGPSQQAEIMASCFNMASVFTVWRPCSNNAIRKMMEGKGVGKGLDIKGKSATQGKLSGYVPFLQIHSQADKYKIDLLPRDARMRIFYGSSRTRQAAIDMLTQVRDEIVDAVDASEQDLSQIMRDSFSESDVHPKTASSIDGDEMVDDKRNGRSSTIASTRSNSSIFNYELASQLKQKWEMLDPSIDLIDDYAAQSIYGVEIAERLFWEAFVIRQDQLCQLWKHCDMETKDGVGCASTANIEQTFAEKLMQRILHITTETNNNVDDSSKTDSVVEWVQNATTRAWSFIILDRDRFVQEVLRPIRKDGADFPSKFSSFVGVLRRSGFREETTGRGHAKFFHQYFQRDRVDLCRLIGSEHDTGRKSMPNLQDDNFKSMRKVPKTKNEPRVVVWHLEEDGDNHHSNLCPHNLLMAYEEHGRVVPVVSDFDGFLMGTKRIHFDQCLPPEQVDLVRSEIRIAQDILEGIASGDSWAARWMYASSAYPKKQPIMPQFGFGDKSPTLSWKVLSSNWQDKTEP